MATVARVTPISQDCSDVELVAAVRRGSDAAFEELYSRYSRRIGVYVRGMVRDHGRAEDVTQEIFIAALRRMRETDRPIAFKPWIYEIAKNACIDSFRRARRAQEVSLDAGGALSSADRGRLTVVTTPDAALDSKQAIHDLRGAFGGLSDSHHEILVLRELEGRSYRDIGERLGMSRPVVESTLFRARRRLAEEYDELASGRRCEFVRKMVDSGPHYSLGIRDRRRIARHLAHCQPCRAHARAADFDESILNMPSVAARIAALLPIPLLRLRWGALERLGSVRGQPSALALRSVHALVRSSDQITASAGAGRGAAAAAAIVLAGVGGGLVSASSYQPAPKPFYRTAVPASGYPAPSTAVAGADRASSQAIVLPRTSVRAKTYVTAAHGSRSRPRAAAPNVAAKAAVPVKSGPSSSAPATGHAPTGAPSAGSTTGSTTGTTTPPATVGAGDPTAAGAIGPTSTGIGSVPTGTGQPPTGPSPTGALPIGVIASTLGAVAGALPTVPAVTGSSSGSTSANPISGITNRLAQLVGH
jgi:RNA polymerase sigma factor (sigma-70 family)